MQPTPDGQIAICPASRLAIWLDFRRIEPDASFTKRPASIVRPGARLMIGGGRTVRARAFEWWSQRTSPSWIVGGCPRTMCLSCGSAAAAPSSGATASPVGAKKKPSFDHFNHFYFCGHKDHLFYFRRSSLSPLWSPEGGP